MIAVRPLGTILSASDAALYRDVSDACERAREAADRLRGQAAREAQIAHEARLTEADREGQRRVAILLAETAAAARQRIAGLSEDVAEAIAAGVARVIGGLDLAEAISHAAREALVDLADQHGVVVRVPPAHAARVRLLLAGWGESARVVGDEEIEPDGCVLETRAGFVRAGLGEQVEILRRALIETARRQAVVDA